jgi:predicted lipid-binding transport protein (Tim44 family)
MGATGGFPIDLVLFGMIAAFLVLRLRSVLGKRTGFERPDVATPPSPIPPRGAPEGRIIEGRAEPMPRRLVPEPMSQAGLILSRMTQIDASFNPARFLDGAEAAFRMIVAAFAAGDRATLRPLLSPDTYAAFESAISGRETAQETQTTDIRAMPTVAIDHAELSGSIAAITVRFVSDQVNVTLGQNGLPVAGADAVTEITDLWTFERDLASPDPAWRLVAARSA